MLTSVQWSDSLFSHKSRVSHVPAVFHVTSSRYRAFSGDQIQRVVIVGQHSDNIKGLYSTQEESELSPPRSEVLSCQAYSLCQTHISILPSWGSRLRHIKPRSLQLSLHRYEQEHQLLQDHLGEASNNLNTANMLASGFTNAPITQLLLLGIVGSAIIASLTDTKYFLWIEVRPHLLDYWQYWRLLTWQLAYTNSAEVLFAAMTFYQLRVIERLWGSRKFAVGHHSTFSMRSMDTIHADRSNSSRRRLTGKYRSLSSFPLTSTPLSSLPSSLP